MTGSVDAREILDRIKYIYVDCDGSFLKLAHRLGISRTMAKCIMQGKRRPGAKVVRSLGFRPITIYAPINGYKKAGPSK